MTFLTFDVDRWLSCGCSSLRGGGGVSGPDDSSGVYRYAAAAGSGDGSFTVVVRYWLWLLVILVIVQLVSLNSTLFLFEGYQFYLWFGFLAGGGGYLAAEENACTTCWKTSRVTRPYRK